ncbi:MAG TPA: chloride channel protein, partial [Thermoanaerobaculia bacterium]|nr:chloride channel protein [Thermoanaerobaculia bacterium]
RAGARRLRRWWGSAELTLAKRFGLSTAEDRRFFLLIPLVGAIGGVFAIAVDSLLEWVRALLWGSKGSFLVLAQTVPLWRVLAAPAAGGLLVGLLVWWSRQPVSGQGTALLIESVVLRQGAVPPRPVLLSTLASIFTVGSGGSLGKEGPLLRLDAMLGSWLGERAGLSPHRVKILLGCGAAAGMAATYNVPVGGALFAMEVILGNFALEIFGPIVAASVIATVISRAALGDVPLYAATGYELQNGWELIPYLGLGVIGAFASVAFVFGIRGAGALFDRARFLPVWIRPAVGLLIVGGIAALSKAPAKGSALGSISHASAHVLGNGFDGITQAVAGQLPLLALLLLPLAKIVASGVTSGSGGAGGTFTPALFVGAMVGGAYGVFVHLLWPFATSPYGAYAAVGMAAIAAGTSHAPISAILILFELTGNYQLILPLMVASITSSFLSRALYRYSVEEESLRRRGVDLSFRMEEAVLAGVEVKSLLRQDPDVLRSNESYAQVVDRFLKTHRQRLFVVDEEGRLEGAVSLHDIKHLLQEPSAVSAVVAHDLATPLDRVLYPDTRLHRVAEAFAQSDFERLPVVDAEHRFLGVLSKKDLLSIYSQEVLGRPAMLATFVSTGTTGGRDYVELPPDFSLRLVPVPAALYGRTLAEANLPQRFGVRIIEIKRGRQGAPPSRVMPAAETRLLRGDELIVIGPTAAIERLERGELGVDEALAHAELD